MSNWKAVFKNKMRRPEDERWACTGGCNAIIDQSHKDTPRDYQCTCPKCVSKTVSDAYKAGFEQIDWSTFESKVVFEENRNGKKRYRF